MSSAKTVLDELVRQVRDHTVQLLRATPAAWLTWAPQGTSNHILWHAGHALWVQDELWVQRLTGSSELPIEWTEMFGMRCRPLKENQHWPPVEQVTRELTAQRQRLLELLGEIPDAHLEPPDPPVAHGWDLFRGLIHGLHDEARHNGEMYLLFKLCRARHGEGE